MRRNIIAGSIVVIATAGAFALEAAMNVVGMRLAYYIFDELRSTDRSDSLECLKAAALTRKFAERLRGAPYWPLLTPKTRRTVMFLLYDELDLVQQQRLLRVIQEGADLFTNP